MTLREGLEEYYAGHPGLLQPNSMEREQGAFFRSHDRCHVLFGLDTTLVDEGLADLWTVFGTDVGVRRYTKYVFTNPAAKQITREIGPLRVIWTTLRIIPLALRVFLRSRSMSRRWSWNGEDQYLDRPLSAIRHDLNIRLL